MIKKVFMLNFEEEPPYDLILEKLTSEIQKNVKLGPDLQPIAHCFEWNISEAQKLKKNIIQLEKFEEENEINFIFKKAQ